MTTPPSTLAYRLRTLPIRRPVWTLTLTAAVCVVAALLLNRLQFDPSLESLFARNDPSSAALLHVLNDFSMADDLLVLISLPNEGHSAGKATDQQAARLIDYTTRLKQAIARDPGAAAMVTAIKDGVAPEARRFIEEVVVPAAIYYLDDAQFEALKDHLTTKQIYAQVQRNEELIATPSPAASAIAKNIARDPLRLYELLGPTLARLRPRGAGGGGDHVLSPDGRSLLLRIQGSRPSFDLEFTQRFMDAMRRAVQAAQPGGLNVGFSGGYAIAEVSHRVIRSDMIFNVIGSVVALLVWFMLVYPRPIHAPLVLLPIAIGVLVSFAVFAVVSPRITPLGAGISSILAGIAVDYGILFLSNYESRRRLGMRPAEAADLVPVIGLDLAMACLTTLAAFAAISVSEVPALRSFAVLGGLSLLISVVATAAVLPSILVLADRLGGVSPPRPPRLRFDPLIAAIDRRPRAFLGGGLLIGVLPAAVLVAVAWPQRSAFEEDLTVMHPRPNPPLDVQKRISELFPGSLGSLAIHLEAKSPDALVTLAHEVDRRLARPEVRRVGVEQTLGLASLLPDPATVEKRRRQAAQLDADRIVGDLKHALAESSFDPAAFDGYIAFLRRSVHDPPAPDIRTLMKYPGVADAFLPKAAFEPGAAAPTQALTVAILDNDLTERARRDEALRVVRESIAGFPSLPGLPGATLTGLSVVTHDVEASVRRDLPVLLFLATGLVIAILLAGTRRIGPSVLAMIPPAVGAVFLMAAMVITGVRFNLVNLVALPLLAGVGVDYGIFLVGAATRYNRGNHGDAAAFVDQFAASGHAVAMCAVTTILGFGSLVFTHTAAMRSLGVVLGASITGTLVGSFFVLLPLLCLQRTTRQRIGIKS